MGTYCKANLTLIKRHWQHKVCGRQVTIKDGLEPSYSNNMTAWIPKLTPKYPKPCAFFHVANKSSATYLRTKPNVLAQALEDVVIALRSDYWLDQWERINEVSDALLDTGCILESDMLDMPLFEKHRENQEKAEVETKTIKVKQQS
jgi:hypothetical protein